MSTSPDTCLKCRLCMTRYCPTCDCGPAVTLALKARVAELEAVLHDVANHCRVNGSLFASVLLGQCEAALSGGSPSVSEEDPPFTLGHRVGMSTKHVVEAWQRVSDATLGSQPGGREGTRGSESGETPQAATEAHAARPTVAGHGPGETGAIPRPSEARHIPSHFEVGDEVRCHIDGGGERVGVVKRITTFLTRTAFHIVESNGQEFGYGTDDLTLLTAHRTNDASLGKAEAPSLDSGGANERQLSQQPNEAEIAPSAECRVNLYMSCACERGVKGCIVKHELPVKHPRAVYEASHDIARLIEDNMPIAVAESVRSRIEDRIDLAIGVAIGDLPRTDKALIPFDAMCALDRLFHQAIGAHLVGREEALTRADRDLVEHALEQRPRPEAVPEHPEARAIRVLAKHFEDIGSEPCSECGYALNEIRDYVNELLDLREKVKSQRSETALPNELAELRKFKATIEHLAAFGHFERCHGEEPDDPRAVETLKTRVRVLLGSTDVDDHLEVAAEAPPPIGTGESR